MQNYFKENNMIHVRNLDDCRFEKKRSAVRDKSACLVV